MIEGILTEAAKILEVGWTQDVDQIDCVTRFNTVLAIEEAASRLSADEATKYEAYRVFHNTVLGHIKEVGTENITDDRSEFYDVYELYSKCEPLDSLDTLDDYDLVIMYDMDESRSKREIVKMLDEAKLVCQNGKKGNRRRKVA